ncbi:MAG TPA: TetR family transcriptional regulator [Mycobacteriales bacterium]|jgi:AcrR family transcriptional regulator|nr:TetR family transcriptional regulator [Mycobacteriales bacterium]
MSVAPVESARDRRRLRARRDLALAAVMLFEQQGFAATPVEEIAAAADYSASTFFRMFTRKEDAVFFDMPDRLESLRMTVPADATWPDVRAALVEHAHTWEADDPAFAAARVRLLHREPSLTSRYLEYCQEYEVWLTELVSNRSGADPQTDVAAQLAAGCIIAAFRSAFSVQAALPARKAASVVEYLEAAFDALEAGPLAPVT